jgi:hypothetical protein
LHLNRHPASRNSGYHIPDPGLFRYATVLCKQRFIAPIGRIEYSLHPVTLLLRLLL